MIQGRLVTTVLAAALVALTAAPAIAEVRQGLPSDSVPCTSASCPRRDGPHNFWPGPDDAPDPDSQTTTGNGHV